MDRLRTIVQLSIVCVHLKQHTNDGEHIYMNVWFNSV